MDKIGLDKLTDLVARREAVRAQVGVLAQSLAARDGDYRTQLADDFATAKNTRAQISELRDERQMQIDLFNVLCERITQERQKLRELHLAQMDDGHDRDEQRAVKLNAERVALSEKPHKAWDESEFVDPANQTRWDSLNSEIRAISRRQNTWALMNKSRATWRDEFNDEVTRIVGDNAPFNG